LRFISLSLSSFVSPFLITSFSLSLTSLIFSASPLFAVEQMHPPILVPFPAHRALCSGRSNCRN
jgi:hypothetical protein